MGLIMVSLLPYLNEVLTIRTEKGVRWSYLFGLERLFPDANVGVLGYSGFRMFLYTLFIFLFTSIGWGVWYYVARKAAYRKALWVPLLLGAYQIIIILGNWRGTFFNGWEVKMQIVAAASLVVLILDLKDSKFDLTAFLKGFLIATASIMPFFHDVITDKATASLREWVPVVGIEDVLKDKDGFVLGFGSYRAFVYFLLIHVGAHLSWLGAYIDYSYPKKKIRPFLLVPAIISFFSLGLFLLNLQDSSFGSPDIKFCITIGLSFLLAWNFFFNDKTGRAEQFETKKTS